MKYEFSISVDYSQIYLEDENTQTNTSVIWTEQALDDFMAVAPGFVAVGTVRNMAVPVEIEVVDSELPENLEQWNHVTECSLDIPSGRLRIMGCTYGDSEFEHIHLTPGNYRVRIYHGGLGTLSENGLEGNDYYRLVMWQGEYLPPTVIKRYPRQ